MKLKPRTIAATLILAVVAGAGFFGAGQVAQAIMGSHPAFVPHANACVSDRDGSIRVLSGSQNCTRFEKPFLIASEEKVDVVRDDLSSLSTEVDGVQTELTALGTEVDDLGEEVDGLSGQTVTVQRVSANFDAEGQSYHLAADCGAGNHATGGGGWSAYEDEQIVRSYPSIDGTLDAFVWDGYENPRYWGVTWSNTSSNPGNRYVFAICVPNGDAP